MSIVAILWSLRADREAGGFARDNRRILLALVAPNLLYAAAIPSAQRRS